MGWRMLLVSVPGAAHLCVWLWAALALAQGAKPPKYDAFGGPHAPAFDFHT